jgi:hypothetical protein
MISCRLSGASSLGLLGMIEHYQKRIEASRYLEPFGTILVQIRNLIDNPIQVLKV